MNLLVVGATGRTGREVVREAVAAGHTVRVFSRSANKVAWPGGVDVVAGDVLDEQAVRAAMREVDGVIVTISMVRASDWPWARILTPLDLHQRAATVLTAAAKAAGVRSYVTMSAHGVGESASRAGTLFLALVRSSNIGVAYAQLAVAEQITRDSGVDATIVRPTRLTQDPPTRRWRASPTLVTTSFDRIPRADVAAFLVEAATTGAWAGQAVSVTTAR